MNDLIRKHNNVIEASYNMNLIGLRVLTMCISQIKFQEKINNKKPFFISAQDYSNMFGIPLNIAYRDVKNAIEAIWQAEFKIDRGENKKPLRARFITSMADYDVGAGGSELYLSSDAIPLLTSLEENYTIYQIKNITKLKSTYAIRFYELLVQYKKIGGRKIQVNELREILYLGDKYKAIKDFKVRVLDVAIKEINAETDLNVSYKNIKKGRSIVALDFTIKAKRKAPIVTKSTKKHLSTAEVYAEFQKPRFKSLQSYTEGFKALEKEGYSFNKASFLLKYQN
jgi:plasmid replication initiation protein